MSIIRVGPPVEFERFAFAFGVIIALTSIAYTAWANSRGLGAFLTLSAGFAPLYVLSAVLVLLGFVLRRKRQSSIKANAALVSRLLESK